MKNLQKLLDKIENNCTFARSDSGLGHFKQPLRRHLAMKRQHRYGADNGLTG